MIPEIVTFDQARNFDTTVSKFLKHGLPLEEIIVMLAREKQILMKRLIKLESIAPRKVRMKDGSLRIWHCPDEFVPEIGAQSET